MRVEAAVDELHLSDTTTIYSLSTPQTFMKYDSESTMQFLGIFSLNSYRYISHMLAGTLAMRLQVTVMVVTSLFVDNQQYAEQSFISLTLPLFSNSI